MPKKKSLWPRDCKCLVCETETVNYQFMSKSQMVELDDWLIPHTKAVGEYEEFPSTLKTTICPACLMSSNEYGYAVDKNVYFTRNMSRNSKLQEFYKTFIDERFKFIVDQFELLEEEAAVLDKERGKPDRMRSRPTLEKVWQLGGDYPKQYFKLLFEEPRDIVTTLVLSSMDRYCQIARIAYEYDIEPSAWDFKTVEEAVCAHYDEHTLDMKMGEPRFYYTASNFMQCRTYLSEMCEHLGKEPSEYEALSQEYFEQAFRWYRYSYNNDDISAIPLELKDGGLHYILARFYRETIGDGLAAAQAADAGGEEGEEGDSEEGKNTDLDALKLHLRGARRYADNALKRIANTNQQNFVNSVDALWNEIFPEEVEEEEEKK